MRRFCLAGYDDHALIKVRFITVDDDAMAMNLARRKCASFDRPDLDWLIYECSLEPIARIEQTANFRKWAKKQAIRKKLVVFDDDE